MGSRVVILKGHSQYGVLRDFADQIGLGFQELGASVNIIELSSDNWNEKFFNKKAPDFVLSFNAINFSLDDKPFYEHYQLPFLGFLVDHPAYLIQRLSDPSCTCFGISCIDVTHVDFARRFLGHMNSIFIPHGADQKLVNAVPLEKDIDILFAGTIVNPMSIREEWKRQESAAVIKLIEETIRLGMDFPGNPVHVLLEKVIDADNNKLDFTEKVDLLVRTIPYVEKYLRCKWRIKVLRSLKNFKLAIVGNGPWEKLVPGTNVTYLPACSFEEANNLMMRSKVVLNIIPMFPAGAHERIFSGMLGRSVVATDKNAYLTQQFTDMQDLIFYDISNLEQFHESLGRVLNDQHLLSDIASAGRKKAALNHTWTNRAEQVLKLFSSN